MQSWACLKEVYAWTRCAAYALVHFLWLLKNVFVIAQM